jgi:hypothetical protein
MSKIVTNQIKPRVGKNLTIDGSVTSSTGTFSSNVSIGGTLTYDDITNVQSTGIVTARTGIDVISNGIDAVGVVTATTFIGDGSQLTGVESGVANFVASGTIPNGQTVIIKDDGTVGVVTQTTSNTPSAGTPVKVDSNAYSSPSDTTACIYDSTNQKVVITYKDENNSYHGTAVVGTVSGTSISFGSAVVFETDAASDMSLAYDSTNSKVVIAYTDVGNSYQGTAIVGNVTGLGITFGSAVVFAPSSSSQYNKAIYDTSNQKIVIFCRNQNNNNYFTYAVGTVSGTSINFSSATVLLNQDLSSSWDAIYDPDTNQIVLAFRESSNGKARMLSLSGSTLSLGSSSVFRTADASHFALSYDTTNNKVVIAYRGPYGEGGRGEAVVGTVSGTSIGFGTHVEYGPSTEISQINNSYDATNGRVVISYQDQDNANGSVVSGTVSGTSIDFGTATIFYSTTIGGSGSNGLTYNNSSTYDSSNNKVVVVYSGGYNPSHVTASAITAIQQTTNLTAGNYIGIAAEDIANGATGKVNILGGVNTGQTGLTTAQTHYVQPNGTLATSAGNPSVVAGTSISSTNLVLR